METVTSYNYTKITRSQVGNYLNNKNNHPFEWMVIFLENGDCPTLKELINKSNSTYFRLKESSQLPSIKESNLINVIPKIFQAETINRVSVNKNPNAFEFYKNNKELHKLTTSEIIDHMYREKILPTTFRSENCDLLYRGFETNLDTDFVWDFSGGYGDRLVWCLRENTNLVITDPNIYLHKGYQEMIKVMTYTIGTTSKVKLHKIGAEKYEFSENIIGVGSSPPYYSFEVYSKHFSQCYIGKTYENWRDGWLIPLILDVKKRNIPLRVNVGNVPKAPIEDDMLRIMQENGYPSTTTYYIALLYNPRKFKKIYEF